MIRVIIERHLAESLSANYEALERQIRLRVVSLPGYISGESLVDADNLNHRFILAKWRSVSDWKQWYESEERNELMLQLSSVLDRPERVSILKLA